MDFLKRAVMVAAVAAAAGCTSAGTRTVGCTWGEPYAATRLSCAYVDEEPALWASIPFDAVLDTVLLPVDLVLMPFVRW